MLNASYKFLLSNNLKDKAVECAVHAHIRKVFVFNHRLPTLIFLVLVIGVNIKEESEN